MPRLPFHLILPFAAGVVYVAAALFLKRAIDGGANVWRATRTCNFVTAVVFAPLLALGGTVPGLSAWWQPLLAALMFLAGQIFSLCALRVGDVSIATPVLGLKIILVAILTTTLLKIQLGRGMWIGAALSSAGIALLNFSRPHSRASVGATIVLAGLAAASYALFDVLVQNWSPRWGAGRFLPIMMTFASLLSLALPSSQPGEAMPRNAIPWLYAGAGCLSLQALMLVSAIATYRHAPLANVLYSSRGLWSVIVVWIAGRQIGSREAEHGHAIFAWRLAGAIVLIVAILFALSDKL